MPRQKCQDVNENHILPGIYLLENKTINSGFFPFNWKTGPLREIKAEEEKLLMCVTDERGCGAEGRRRR